MSLALFSLLIVNFQPTEIENLEIFPTFVTEQREILEKNSFLVTPSKYDEIYEIYQYAKDSKFPIYLTTDAILHTFHTVFENALRTIETEYFSALLQELAQKLLDYEQQKYQTTKSPKTKSALKKNIAFLSVGLSLLDKNFKPSKEVSKIVEDELSLIKKHKGFAQSGIFGVLEDYTQYIPRGHYTRTELLKAYFQAMMWFSRIGFYLRPGNKKNDWELGRNLTRAAILLCDALKNSQGLKIWERINRPLTFLIGKSDDLNYYDYQRIIEKSFTDIFKDLEKDEKVDKFIEQALKLPPPKILSTFVPDTLKFGLVTKGFRLFGQRFIPDSYIFQELVYDRVGTQENPRTLPKGLDIMAVLGSERAWEILDKIYNENRFLNYTQQLNRLTNQFSKVSFKEWQETVYWGWLYTLKLLLEPLEKSDRLPQFLFKPAYADKTLMTGLGSWTQLRHDTILYAKQSYTVGITGIISQPAEVLAGYVEPYYKVYEQIAFLCEKLEALLLENNILVSEVSARLKRLKDLSSRLKEISLKEIKGNDLSIDDLNLIKNIGEELKDLITFPAKQELESPQKMALVVDVHTDPNTKSVLQEAVGNPFLIYALIPYKDKSYLAVGGVFSYYEFTRPMQERMIDEVWQKLEPKPDLPVWTKSYIVK